VDHASRVLALLALVSMIASRSHAHSPSPATHAGQSGIRPQMTRFRRLLRADPLVHELPALED
jgi:hypothetical protein